MQNMQHYYDFSGQKFGYPLSLSINSFKRQVFSRQSSLEISYVLKGAYEAVTEHFTAGIKEHELVIVAPNDIHMIRQMDNDKSVILTLHIDFSRFSAGMCGNIEEAFESMICTRSKNYRLLCRLRNKIGELVRMLLRGESSMFQMNAIMMELVYIASNHRQYPVERLPLQSVHHENYMKAIQYIDCHFSSELHSEDVAKTLSFSVSYTSKLFKKYTGISFVKYLAYVRIRASLEALLEGKDSIEQIAADCGMPNSKSYTAAFRELYGIVPSDYRKKFTQNIKMNENHKEQSMSFDIEQKELLEHLIADTQEVLYENDGIKITQQEGHIQCRIQHELITKTTITQTDEELVMEFIRK